MPADPLQLDALTVRLAGHLKRLGTFDRVATEEPTSPPGKGLTAALMFDELAPHARSSGANTLSVGLRWTLRLYKPAFTNLRHVVDRELLAAASRVISALAADLLLGDEVMAVDLHGIAGVRLGAKAGFVQMDQRVFRIVDVTVPVLVADVWTVEA